MGRPEKPIGRELKSNAQLAAFLRKRRAVGAWTYEELAEQSDGLSRQTLQRAAAGGMTVPSWPVVSAFIRATSPLRETDTELDRATKQAMDLWRKARYEQRQKTMSRRSEPPVLALVRSEADLAAVLVELYERSGAPSMKTMERRAGGLGILPHSTAHRIVTRKTLPYTLVQFDAFLNACDVTMQRRDPWYTMWARVVGMHPVELRSELAKLHASLPSEGHTRSITDTPNRMSLTANAA
ncbi:helix-turn-helix transcriptional regulator [Streptomyces europaeiscabiei]|uniref:helix-turn-helix domain-containing protein n=1 Tax=Streptomyces europaeiscabiei TaxID=146819 RepID=UPI002E2803BE|nr:helix-turn-helix transcriptional regulator [Streptomyces europaeiscabiei]